MVTEKNMENISISLQENSSQDISEIRVDGVIDTMTAGELEDVIGTILQRKRYRLVIDLGGVEYISSAGWGIFISHIKDIHDNEGDLKLANMIPNVLEIYELLEFDNVLKSYNSLEEAREDFNNSGPSDTIKKKAD